MSNSYTGTEKLCILLQSGSISSVVKAWADEDIDSDRDGYGCIGLNNNIHCNRHSNVIINNPDSKLTQSKIFLPMSQSYAIRNGVV